MKGLPVFSEEISMVFPQEYIDDNGAQKYGTAESPGPTHADNPHRQPTPTTHADNPRRQPTPTTHTGRLLRCQDFGQ